MGLLGKIYSNFFDDDDDDDDNLLVDGVTALAGLVGGFFGALLDDQDGDGDVDEDDAQMVVDRAKIFVSLMAHAAMADGKIVDAEYKCISYLVEIISKEWITQEVLDLLGKKRKNIKKEITDTFSTPVTLKKISKYGKENELEENLYITACDVCFSDEELHDDERELLDTLAELLELSKFDKRLIEKKYLESPMEIPE